MWAQERSLCPPLVVPWVDGHQPPNKPADLDAHWETARRLLHDDNLDVADRVAGALVVIYAQPVTRVARLTRADVIGRDGRDGEVSVRFGKHAVLMPEPLGSLVRQLPQRRHGGVSARLDGSSQWLFPGKQPGGHLQPDSLRVRLAKISIDSRASRNAALIQLATEVPVAVLADMLNLHPNTAARWAETAGANWTNYAAAVMVESSSTRSGP